MHLQAHAALGWLLGGAAPASDRRLRAWCLAAAVLPDLDGATFLLGPSAYAQWHHTFGHNVFAGVLVTAAAFWHHVDRPWARRLLAGGAVALAFGSHLLTDLAFSEWHVHPWWPVSNAHWATWGYYLAHPVNTWLVLASYPAVILVAFWRNATPLELLSPALDRAFLNAFRAKTLACAACGRRCNNLCAGCGRPICLRHGRITRTLRLSCAACVEDGGPAAVP